MRWGFNAALALEFFGVLAGVARSPSGKAKVCKTFIVGSIPSRASKISP